MIDINQLKREVIRINDIQKYIDREVRDDRLRNLLSRPNFRQKYELCMKLYGLFVTFVLEHSDIYGESEMKFFLRHPVRVFRVLSVMENKKCFRIEIGEVGKSKALLIPFKMITNPSSYADIKRWKKRMYMNFYKDDTEK